MSDSLGTCYLAGDDVPISLFDITGWAEQAYFGVDVEIIRQDAEIHVFTMGETTHLGIVMITGPPIALTTFGPSFPACMVVAFACPGSRTTLTPLDKVHLHGHPRSMPCSCGGTSEKESHTDMEFPG